jgi:C-terminal processing protease CtpA/Prc
MVDGRARNTRSVDCPRRQHILEALLGLSLLASGSARAQLNLDFETAGGPAGVPGWEADDAELALDAAAARTGRLGLRVTAGSAGRARFSQTLDTRALTGDRVRVSAYVRAAAPAAAGLRIRVDGGGRLLYIARSRAEPPMDASGWRRVAIEAPLAPEARRVELGGEVAEGVQASFDDFRVELLHARDLPAPSAIARRYVEQALAIIDEHAVARSMLDWAAYRSAVLEQAGGAVTTADAHLAVQYALTSLDDGHSYLMTPRQMATLDDRPVGNARTARAPTAPHAELLDGAFGYLRLPGIAGGDHVDRVEFAETVQALIAAHDAAAACGWILDLRDNEGGNLWPMLAGVGPLLGDGDVGASIRPGGERRSLWHVDGKAGLGDFVQLRVRGAPYTLVRDNAPVAVLLNDETASAAEIIALAFAGRPAARSFGTATAGAGTGTRTFPLSDGAALMLAVTTLADRQGRVLHGRIVPDEPVGEAGRGEPLTDQAIVAAAGRWLRVQSGCAGPASTALVRLPSPLGRVGS